MLDCIVHEPQGAATSAVIWLHGLGASGHDFLPVVPHLGLDRTRFVFPHAPVRPVTINGGMRMPSWYDILTLARTAHREHEPDIRAAHELVEELIAHQVEQGVPDERIVLAGFSQGGAMVLHTGLRHPRALAGLIVLSGYLLLPDTLTGEQSEANRATPLLAMHGTRDDVVPHAGGRASFERVQQGRPATWREYPMGHEVCGPQIRDIRDWLHERLD